MEERGFARAVRPITHTRSRGSSADVHVTRRSNSSSAAMTSGSPGF
jgi:hypothetical protein